MTVYFGQHKGSASTSDLSPQAIRETVRAACNIARCTSEDPYAGLADPDLMAREIPPLDLHHPWPIAAGDAVEHARACEDAARAHDARITNSEGATLDTHQGVFVYGNSHGFLGGYPTSRHSLSCAVIGEDGTGGMQRETFRYWCAAALAWRHSAPSWTPSGEITRYKENAGRSRRQMHQPRHGTVLAFTSEAHVVHTALAAWVKPRTSPE